MVRAVPVRAVPCARARQAKRRPRRLWPRRAQGRSPRGAVVRSKGRSAARHEAVSTAREPRPSPPDSIPYADSEECAESLEFPGFFCVAPCSGITTRPCPNPVHNICISSGHEQETSWKTGHFSNVRVEPARRLRIPVDDDAVLDAPSTATPRMQSGVVTHATRARSSSLHRSLTSFSTAHRVHEDDEEEKKDLVGNENQNRAALEIPGAGTP